MGLKEKLKMKYKIGEKVKLVKPITFPNGVTIPNDVELEIIAKDPFLKSYDISYDNQIYTEFSESDFQ